MVRWAFVGTGGICTKVLRDFTYVKGGQVVGVVGSSYEKAKDFALRNQLEKAYQSYEELLEDDDIDAVYIGTPHQLHYEMSLKALEAKKSVLCEKPMGINKKQVEVLIAKAKDKNVFLMEGLWSLFLPAMGEVFEWINNGSIGRVTTLKADFSFGVELEDSSRLRDPEKAGGALLDVGIYPVAIVTAIARMLKQGKVASAYIDAEMTTTGVDAYDMMQVRYENGLIAQMSCGMHSQGDCKMIISGSKGYIEIPSFFRSKKAYLYVGEDQTDYTCNADFIGYVHEFNEANELIKGGALESQKVSHELTLEVIELLDYFRSAIGLVYPFE